MNFLEFSKKIILKIKYIRLKYSLNFNLHYKLFYKFAF
jgi:hypothetical protein